MTIRIRIFRILFGILCIILLLSLKGGDDNQDRMNREPDRIKYFSGSGNAICIHDSIFFYYGDFYLTSESKNSRITAKRLKLSPGPLKNTGIGNYFENDFLSGKVYKEIIDVYTNVFLLKDLMEYSADKILYSSDSLLISLRGNAKISGMDIIIESNNIDLILDTCGGKTIP